MAAENKMMEIERIGCLENSICHESDFEDDAFMD